MSKQSLIFSLLRLIERLRQYQSLDNYFSDFSFLHVYFVFFNYSEFAKKDSTDFEP